MVLQYHPNVNLDWVTQLWRPATAVLGSATSLNLDRKSEGIASVCLDEEKVAGVA
jgi:hypothetical protein